MGKIFDSIRENLQLQMDKNTGPLVQLTHYYVDDSGRLMTHLYQQGVAHDCDVINCPVKKKELITYG